MEKKRVLQFKLLGGIRFREAGEPQWRSLESMGIKGVGKKQLAFLVYILLNNKRVITAEELVETFWPGDSKDPANALKNTLHKNRTLLKTMFPQSEDLILTQHAGYCWSNQVELELDTDRMEQVYRSLKPDALASADTLKEAIALYEGEILSGSGQIWLDHINVYYRNVYIDLCKVLMNLLQDASDWEEAARVSRQAYAYTPEVEEITLCLMNSLLAVGQAEQAVQHYEVFRSMLWREYSLVPSERVEQIHDLAVEHSGNAEDYERELLRQLTQMPEPLQAFNCSLTVFRNLVQLELRNMRRNGHQSSVVVLQAMKDAQSGKPSTDTRRVERTLLQALRAGDPFTKLNLGSFAVLLPTASVENAQKVMERVDKSFHSAYPRSRAALQYRVYPLTPHEE
ncbi:MAG: hypothetical protein IJA84_06820 [Clostridia bacterium]|nr:hypothetical protein [Clostridia bacterium]